DDAADRDDRNGAVLAPGGLDRERSWAAPLEPEPGTRRAEHRPGHLDDLLVELLGAADPGQPAGELEQRAGDLGALLLGLEQYRLLERHRRPVREAFEQAHPLIREVSEILPGGTNDDPAAHAEARVEGRNGGRPELGALGVAGEDPPDLVVVDEERRLA